MFLHFQETLRSWKSQTQNLHLGLESRISEVDHFLKQPQLMKLTRQRLKTLKEGFQLQHGTFQSLLPFRHQQDDVLQSLFGSIEARDQQEFLQQYGNIFRDWSWGESECLATVERLLQWHSSSLTNALFCGSGAARVPYEWHQRAKPQWTVATEINPLLASVARKLTAGQKISICEFPELPINLDSVVIKHQLTALKGATERFQVVLTDFHEDAFKPESFDLVVTDWFLDIISNELDKTVRQIHRLLPVGGMWFNSGPLMFKGRSLPATPEEVLWQVEKLGFEILQSDCQDLPYMHSPFDGHKRIERVVCFIAQKKSQAREHNEDLTNLWLTESPWLQDTQIAIPVFPGMEDLVMSLQFQNVILSLVDGQESVESITKIISEKLAQADPASSQPTAVEDIRKFVIRTLASASRAR